MKCNDGPRDSVEQARQQNEPGDQGASPHIKEVWFPGTHSDM